MASVWQNKYQIGTKFELTSRAGNTGVNSINKHSKKSYKANDIFIKVAPTNKAIDIIHNSDQPESFYVQSEETKEIFKIEGTGSTIQNYFNVNRGSEVGRQLPAGISVTSFLETFALMSLLGVRKLNDALNYGKQGDMLFDPKIFKDVNDYTKAEILDILTSTESLGKPTGFIHAGIDDFYKALANYEKGIQQIKANTSDIVLIFSGHSKGQIISALNSKYAYKPDSSNNGMITLSNDKDIVKFKQVSLKASKEGARWGRITTLMKQLTNMNESSELEEALSDYDYPWLPDEIRLDEGFRGFIDKAINLGSMTIKKFNQIRKSVFEFLAKLKTMFKASNFKKELESDTKRYLKRNKDINAIMLGGINENRLEDTTKKILKNIDSKIDRLSDLVNSGSSELIKLHVKKSSNLKITDDLKYFNLLACNEISLECLTRLVPIINSSGAPEHVSQIVDLMRRGSTGLPVVVVYSDGTKPEVLGDVDPVTPKDSLESVIITIHPSGDTHYVINIYYLIEITPDVNKSRFVKVQMTNSQGASAISWKVDGLAPQTYEHIMKSV